MNFYRFCEQHSVTKQEREALAWQLSMIRARQIYRMLCGGWNGPKL
jgi:hypothetical protein